MNRTETKASTALRQWRSTNGRDQAALAKLIGVSQAMASQLEGGGRRPGEYVKRRIAETCGIPVADWDVIDHDAPARPVRERRKAPSHGSWLLLRWRLAQSPALTQEDAALQLCMRGQGAVSDLELGARRPSMRLAITLRDRFGIPIGSWAEPAPVEDVDGEVASTMHPPLDGREADDSSDDAGLLAGALSVMEAEQ